MRIRAVKVNKSNYHRCTHYTLKIWMWKKDKTLNPVGVFWFIFHIVRWCCKTHLDTKATQTIVYYSLSTLFWKCGHAISTSYRSIQYLGVIIVLTTLNIRCRRPNNKWINTIGSVVKVKIFSINITNEDENWNVSKITSLFCSS